jgi:hypothetical protein
MSRLHVETLEQLEVNQILRLCGLSGYMHGLGDCLHVDIIDL